MVLGVGERLPNFSLTDENNTRRLLYEVVGSKPALVIWMRHTGCQFFAQTKKELEVAAKDPPSSLLQVVCVVPGRHEGASLVLKPKPPWIHVLADPYLSTYKQMGFPKFSMMKLLRPTGMHKQAVAFAKSRGCEDDWMRTILSGNDYLQLPGAVIMSFDRKIRWMHSGEHPADLPTLPTMLDKARELIIA